MVTSRELKDYRMYVGASDYGSNLNVSWYLTCELGFFKAWFSAIFEKDPFALSYALDLFHQEDLAAYVANVHHCLLEAVDNLMRGLGQDPSRINRKSRGFLGVS